MLCLALGIGATSTVYGVVDTLYLRAPPGIADPTSVVRPYLTMTSDTLAISGRAGALAYPLYDEIRGQARSVEGMAGYGNLSISIGLGS